MKSVTVTLVALVVAMLSAEVRADNLRVPKDYDTIQEAIDAAQSGDTVVVSKGDYSENVVISGKSDIRLRGKGKPTVSAAATGPALEVVKSSDIEVRGLTFTNGMGSTGSGVHVTGCADVLVSRCTIQENQDDGVSVEDSAGIVIERCKVYDNGDDGICFFETADGFIYRNKIDGTGEMGIEVGTNVGLSLATDIQKNRVDDAGEDGIRISGSSVVVERNSVQDSADSGIIIEDDLMSPITDVEICKNRIKLSGDEGIALYGSGAVVEKNNVQDSDGSGIFVGGTGEHTICKNKVTLAHEGVDVRPGADGNTFEKNKVSKAGADGFDVESSGNVFEKNSAKQSGDNGFEVSASGNSFTGNKAAKSGGFDLKDDAGGNTYDKNKFKTEDIDDGS